MYVYPGTSTIHAHTFATALGCEVSAELRKDDWVLFCGVKPGLPFEEAQKLGKVAGYWIGSDSLTAIQDANYRKAIPKLDAHLCVHERIQRELKAWEVEASVVYPCARNYTGPLEEKPWPKEKCVGIYSPTPGPGDLYMFTECLEVARENPELKFLFYGAKEYPKMPENCMDSGRMSPEETADLFSKFTVMLRMVQHDGNPVGGIEAKQRGLHVIENYPYDGFLYADSIEKVNAYLREPKTHERDVGPWAAYYREVGAPSYFNAKVRKILGCG